MWNHFGAMEHHVPYGVASVIWHPTRVNVLSLSHSWGHRSLPQSIPGSPKVVVDQLRTDACDEFLGIRSRGGRGCSALLSQWSWRRAAGDHSQWSPVIRLTSGPDASTTRRWPHRKQANMLHLNPSQAGRYLNYLPRMNLRPSWSGGCGDCSIILCNCIVSFDRYCCISSDVKSY